MQLLKQALEAGQPEATCGMTRPTGLSPEECPVKPSPHLPPPPSPPLKATAPGLARQAPRSTRHLCFLLGMAGPFTSRMRPRQMATSGVVAVTEPGKADCSAGVSFPLEPSQAEQARLSHHLLH